MVKFLAIGLLISGFLGLGALGTIVGDYDLGIMSRDYEGMGSGMGSMMDDDDMHGMHEECEEHMEGHCEDVTYGECDELHEDCENHLHESCDHEPEDGDGDVDETDRLSFIT